MIYFVSLKLVALLIGLGYCLGHLPGVLWPKAFIRYVKQFPRNFPLGVILVIAAGLWASSLLATMDLGEFSGSRNLFVIGTVLGTVLTLIFVTEFLAVRGLAALLLLGAAVVLDAAFLHETSWRYLMTLLAYVWIIAGMALICVPYWLRDILNFCLCDETRCRLACWPGILFGLMIIGVSFFAY